ncbi:MAG: hypothetical protein J6T10_02805 [Methanobrevibacter sp.]|nr:hypothetical protein [Methanobrevibacter sp.]
MDWNAIGTQVIIGIVGVIISGLGIFVTYLINKWVKNDELKQIMNSLYQLVKSAVLEIQQTYVDQMKKDNIFDYEAQKLAVEKCIKTIKANMPIKVEEWLKSNFKDIEAYLKTLIEAQVKLIKIGG